MAVAGALALGRGRNPQSSEHAHGSDFAAAASSSCSARKIANPSGRRPNHPNPCSDSDGRGTPEARAMASAVIGLGSTESRTALDPFSMRVTVAVSFAARRKSRSAPRYSANSVTGASAVPTESSRRAQSRASCTTAACSGLDVRPASAIARFTANRFRRDKIRLQSVRSFFGFGERGRVPEEVVRGWGERHIFQVAGFCRPRLVPRAHPGRSLPFFTRHQGLISS